MADDRIADWKTPVFFVLAVLLIAVASYIAGGVKGRKTGREIGYKAGYEDGWCAPRPADTLVVRDTLLIDRPEVVYQYIEKPVYLAVHDTQIVRTTDSVFVALEREVKGYSGEDYKAQVSGVAPALDWIEVFPKTITITSETPAKKIPRVGLGATIGGAVVVDKSGAKVGPGAAVGLTIRF